MARHRTATPVRNAAEARSATRDPALDPSRRFPHADAGGEDLYADIVGEHADEAAFLWHLRTQAIGQPHYLLRDLEDLDQRLSAAIDGLRTAPGGLTACRRLLAHDEAWAAAPLALMALESEDLAAVHRLLAIAEAKPTLAPMLMAASGWASPRFLQGTIRDLLNAPSPLWRRLALACCAMHRVDPGPALARAIEDADPSLRARGLQAAGELGRRDLLDHCVRALKDDHRACRYRAAGAALLLGERDRAIETLTAMSLGPGRWRERALRRVVKAMPLDASRELLRTMATSPSALREVIAGMGHTGDATHEASLIAWMHDPALARLAAESFSLLTGADLAKHELERRPPAMSTADPSDDPDDDEITTDPDEHLPWPDADRVLRWWQTRQTSRQSLAPGRRLFVGRPLDAAVATELLAHGPQRQRIAAAQHLCLLQPGTMLFPTDAPVWRQRRLLPTTPPAHQR
ncbi:TIGR02270 family protein [Roseateles chitinivorans]|uniref:TIGR02270 family protein n=1 Tax=Roseateles chitinivorans TaxID=2917965 RepID=UPI003D677703